MILINQSVIHGCTLVEYYLKLFIYSNHTLFLHWIIIIVLVIYHYPIIIRNSQWIWKGTSKKKIKSDFTKINGGLEIIDFELQNKVLS
jgi:hypothetical protein